VSARPISPSLGGATVEAGHSTLFTSATALLSTLAKAETEGQLADKLIYFAKPKLLVVDELGYLPFQTFLRSDSQAGRVVFPAEAEPLHPKDHIQSLVPGRLGESQRDPAADVGVWA
jgi:hypothetical protein